MAVQLRHPLSWHALELKFNYTAATHRGSQLASPTNATVILESGTVSLALLAGYPGEICQDEDGCCQIPQSSRLDGNFKNE